MWKYLALHGSLCLGFLNYNQGNACIFQNWTILFLSFVFEIWIIRFFLKICCRYFRIWRNSRRNVFKMLALFENEWIFLFLGWVILIFLLGHKKKVLKIYSKWYGISCIFYGKFYLFMVFYLFRNLLNIIFRFMIILK